MNIINSISNQVVTATTQPNRVLDLPIDVMGIISESFLFREAASILKTLNFSLGNELRACAHTAYSMADVIHFITKNWKGEKREETRQLIQEYYSALVSEEKQKAFLEALSSVCAHTEDPKEFLQHLLNSLPQDIHSLSLEPFFKFVTDDHVRLIVERFTSLQTLEIYGSTTFTEKAFPDHPNMSQWRRLKLIHCGAQHLGELLTKTAFNLLFKSKHLNHLQELSMRMHAFYQCWSKDQLAPLSRSAFLNTLETLSLYNFALRAIPEAPLKKLELDLCPFLTRDVVSSISNMQFMTHLKIYGPHVSKSTDEDIALIAQSPHMRFLTNLTLNDHFYEPFLMTNASIMSIAESPYMEKLQELDVSQNTRFTDGAWISLANSKYVKGLRVLKLSDHGELTDEGILALANSSNIAMLEHLAINSCKITAKGAEALARSPFLRQLQTLEICELGNRDAFPHIDVFFSYVAKSENMKNLRVLAVCWCSFLTDAAIKSIADSPYMQNLHTLKIIDCWITDAAAAAIAGSQNMRNLKILSFRQCQRITNQGVASIANSPYMDQLESLNLRYAKKVNDPAAISLANSPYMRHLKEIDFGIAPGAYRSEAITDAFLEAIALSPHLTRLELLKAHRFEIKKYRTLSEVAGVDVVRNPQAWLCKLDLSFPK